MTDLSLAAEWRSRLDECACSGLTVVQWCAERGIPTRRYYYWHKRLSPSQSTAPSQTVEWVPLGVNSQTACEATLTVCVGSASIELARGFDQALLREIVIALDGDQ